MTLTTQCVCDFASSNNVNYVISFFYNI